MVAIALPQRLWCELLRRVLRLLVLPIVASLALALAATSYGPIGPRSHHVSSECQRVLEEEGLDWISSPRHFDDGGAIEVPGEEARVQGRGHEDHPELRAPPQQAPQRQQQEVALLRALVHLVHDDMGGALQFGILLHPSQQDASGHEQQLRGISGTILQANGVAHETAGTFASFLGHAVRHADGADAPRLRADDAAGHPGQGGLL
mmetsp:Transcript_163218/g.396682  ORF Transcript_163218/g.396682 Transcript_163218/m.396682 type:complete len:206 (+) Transcript_163218:701-1318(+)